MRFDSLHLPAFGPFTGLRLDFPCGAADLHLLYGPNEAGKSSLLRGIRDLLYEIPRQSTDNFLHKHADMCLGADLRSRDGRTLSIQRRKRNKDTLLGSDGTPLPDEALASWLGHVDREYFTTMFGLASDDLARGGREMLEGKGDLGKALFSASLGGTPVHKILETLSGEAKSYFAGRARARLRTNAGSYADEIKLARDLLIRPEDWESVEHDLSAASQRQSAIEQQRSTVQARIDWLQRCLDALPTLGRGHAKEQELAALPSVPQLPASFIADVRAALQSKRQAAIEARRWDEETARLAAQLADCRPRLDLLERETDIEALHQALSIYRDQRARRTAKQAELTALEPVLRAGMRDLAIEGDLEALNSLRLTAPEFAELKELAAHLAASLQKRETHASALRDKEAGICQLESKLAKLTAQDVTGVREALAQSAAAAEVQRTLDVAEIEWSNAEREMRYQHRLLAGAPPELAATHALRLPAKAAATALQVVHEDLLRTAREAAQDHAEAVKLVAKLRRDLAQLELGGALPSLADLTTARARRESVWQQLVKASGDASAFKPIASEHQQIQQQVDDLGDRLREHADHVAKADQLRTRITEGEEHVAATALQMETISGKQAEWQIRWNALWQAAGIEARPPAEMQEWREAWQEFCRRFEHWQSLSEGVARRKTLIAEAAQRLGAALEDPLARPFIVLLDEAKRLVAKADKDEGAGAALTQQLAEAMQERDQLLKDGESLATAMQASADTWHARCHDLHLASDVTHVAGIALIEERRSLVTRFDAWKAMQAEALQLQAQIQAFDLRATELATALGLEAAPADAQAVQLWRMLEQAREARHTQRTLASQLEAAQIRQRDQQLALESASAALAALRSLASLDDEAALEPLLGALETHDRLRSERDQLRESLHGPARGEVLENFIARVQAEDRETLASEKSTLEVQLESLNAQRDQAKEQAFEATRRKTALEQAGDAAAMHRQKAESHAASLCTDAGRYVRLRLATHFLEQQIERFRAENQAPLMKRASALFKAMTLGSFDGLTTDYADANDEVIVGQRHNQCVPVTGMSEGTRDQLYLSLRLAAIERHIESHEPLPLILDDLLMTFDDTRAAAILPVLEELSKKAQVLLFTHHEHLIDLCQRTLKPGEFAVHRLEK